MIYEYLIRATPTEKYLDSQRPFVWEPCDLTFRVCNKFKCPEKTARQRFRKFVESAPNGYVYRLCQDKGYGFFEIEKNKKEYVA